MVVTHLFFHLKQTSRCTLGDNISSLNATEVVQLVPMEPLQLIVEERRNIHCLGFVLPAEQLHLKILLRVRMLISISILISGARYTSDSPEV